MFSPTYMFIYVCLAAVQVTQLPWKWGVMLSPLKKTHFQKQMFLHYYLELYVIVTALISQKSSYLYFIPNTFIQLLYES